MPGYLGNISWDQLKPYAGDSTVETAKNAINDLKASILSVESSRQDFIDRKISSLREDFAAEVSHSLQTVGNNYSLWGIRDYDGNFHGNTGVISLDARKAY